MFDGLCNLRTRCMKESKYQRGHFSFLQKLDIEVKDANVVRSIATNKRQL
jgi:hypothetical protein